MHETYNIKRTKVGSGPIFGAAILLEPMHSVLLSDATDEADLAKEVFLGAMVVDEQQVPKEGGKEC